MLLPQVLINQDSNKLSPQNFLQHSKINILFKKPFFLPYMTFLFHTSLFSLKIYPFAESLNANLWGIHSFNPFGSLCIVDSVQESEVAPYPRKTMCLLYVQNQWPGIPHSQKSSWCLDTHLYFLVMVRNHKLCADQICQLINSSQFPLEAVFSFGLEMGNCLRAF